MASGFILAFHSYNIAGNSYSTNDHVALEESVAILRRMRVPVLRLRDVVVHLRKKTLDSLPGRFVCITFDDGPDYDWHDMHHPVHGRQPSMHSILRKSSLHFLGPLWIRKACATSFVIASPKARSEIGARAEPPVEMTDVWWRKAQASGLLDIGSHGWNHLHPSASEMRDRPELIEAFHKISTMEDADLQMRASFEFIRDKAGDDSARLFAYPWGQVSEFLANEYLPNQSNYLAAFTTEGRPLREDCNPWRLPRYVCGWDWKTDADLCKLLANE